MMNPHSRRTGSTSSIVISAVFLGIVVLFAAWGSAWVVDRLAADGAVGWMSTFVTYSVMLAVTLILVLASTMGDPTGFGFTRPREADYGAGVVWGLVLGIIASMVMLAGGAGGISALRTLNFWETVLLVWIFAAIAEETLVRGYVQSYMEPLAHRGFNAFGLRLSVPVILSALFFSAMHLILLTTDTSRLTIYIVLVFTFFLGLVAAYQRERSGSLVPPILTHVFFNIGGFLGGILYVLVQIVIFGKTAAEIARAMSG